MDNLTHSLFGLTLARTPLGRVGPGATAALILASNVPDIDIVVAATGGAPRYLSLHRGPTHGPLGLILLSLAVAALVRAAAAPWAQVRGAPPPASLLRLWAASSVGVLLHVLMDLPTSYGTRWLSPFSWTWFTLDWMPVVDVYLLAILVAGIVAGGVPGRRATAPQRRRAAAAALMLATAFYAVRGAAHHLAIRSAQPPSALVSEWCPDAVRPTMLGRWPVAGANRAGAASAADCVKELVAVPDFLSPFRWRLVARYDGEYRAADLDLAAGLRGRAVWASPVERVANAWNAAVHGAARAPAAQTFLGFSRLPAVHTSREPDGSVLVRWVDLRFVRGEGDVRNAVRNRLFGATVVIDESGAVQRQRLGP